MQDDSSLCSFLQTAISKLARTEITMPRRAQQLQQLEEQRPPVTQHLSHHEENQTLGGDDWMVNMHFTDDDDDDDDDESTPIFNLSLLTNDVSWDIICETSSFSAIQPTGALSLIAQDSSPVCCFHFDDMLHADEAGCEEDDDGSSSHRGLLTKDAGSAESAGCASMSSTMNNDVIEQQPHCQHDDVETDSMHAAGAHQLLCKSKKQSRNRAAAKKYRQRMNLQELGDAQHARDLGLRNKALLAEVKMLLGQAITMKLELWSQGGIKEREEVDGNE